jgi:ATP-binding cassette subfamily E protein 1
MPPKKNKNKKDDGEEHLTRIAIVNAEKCKPKKCRQECKKSCPVVKLGKLCIEVGPKSKIAFISEPLCIGKLEKVVKSLVLFYRFDPMQVFSH